MKSESTLFNAAALTATTLGILTLSLLSPGWKWGEKSPVAVKGSSTEGDTV